METTPCGHTKKTLFRVEEDQDDVEELSNEASSSSSEEDEVDDEYEELHIGVHPERFYPSSYAPSVSMLLQCFHVHNLQK